MNIKIIALHRSNVIKIVLQHTSERERIILIGSKELRV